jgi:zinc finger protein, putative
MNNRNEDKTTSEVFDDKEELAIDTKVLSEIKKESKGLKMFQYHAHSIPQPVGDIEETTPGQFKCRFCEKTFDRIFSVHRHERVHTGYKPCICKACGRGFSEKRNLRHHIIRFHSDGSGRELLKRARKDKTLAGNSFFRKAINRLANHSQSLNLLSNSTTNDNESNINNNNINSNNINDNDENQSDLKRLEEENNGVEEMTTGDGHILEECNMEIENDGKSNPEKELQEVERGSSFRRKKNKPSKKVISIENHLESGAKLKQEIGDDSLSSVKDKMDIKDNDSNEANSSVNSDSENKMRLHGAFFSSYNPR